MKNIIFDIGLVLIVWNPDRVYHSYFKDEKRTKSFYEETGIFKLNHELDKGLQFDDGLKSLSASFPHYEEPIRMWKDKWTDMIGGLVDDSVKILKELHRMDYPLYAITNWSMETFPYVLDKYDFFQCFRDIVISGQEKTAKPLTRIYEILLERNRLVAGDCIFIEDNKDNVEGAKKVGMQAIHFETPEKLIEDLKSMGIDLNLC